MAVQAGQSPGTPGCKGSAVTLFKFFTAFVQKASYFHFALGLTNYLAELKF